MRAAETVAAGSRGYDAANYQVQGTERHVIVDTLSLLLVVIVTAAGVQDRDGAKPALARLHDWYERITLIWADSAYAGKLVRAGDACGTMSGYPSTTRPWSCGR
ncbi:transposase [Nonomuraea sp. 10N515B]|uniref:transposase n=1 Tax=Nonomuraea sp. 10N515B TaxID=3457422 RepID=UPI003FCD9240